MHTAPGALSSAPTSHSRPPRPALAHLRSLPTGLPCTALVTLIHQPTTLAIPLRALSRATPTTRCFSCRHEPSSPLTPTCLASTGLTLNRSGTALIHTDRPSLANAPHPVMASSLPSPTTRPLTTQDATDLTPTG